MDKITNYLSPMVKLIKHEEASRVFNRDLFYTDEEMRFVTDHNDEEITIIVPVGFLTDGATIPKVFQKLLPVWDTYYQAAVFHDYLCEYLMVYLGDTLIPLKITRTTADAIFNKLMKILNTNPIKRKIVNGGVVTYSHVKSIIYPSALITKRKFENEIRADLVYRNLARENQKKKAS